MAWSSEDSMKGGRARARRAGKTRCRPGTTRLRTANVARRACKRHLGSAKAKRHGKVHICSRFGKTLLDYVQCFRKCVIVWVMYDWLGLGKWNSMEAKIIFNIYFI